MTRTPDRENLRTKFIPDRDIAVISKTHPEVLKYGFCPTCNGEKYYRFRSTRRRACDCELQAQLYKHYLIAGIPANYQRLDWRDFEGPPEVLDVANKYLKKLDQHVASSIGLYLSGTNGIGKTFILTLMLKDLICMGYKCFFTTADDMFEMKTDGWHNEEEKARYNNKVKNSKVLVIDDAGKEFPNKMTKQIFESLVRYRNQNSLLTFISSNKSAKQARAEHGESFYSLITESFIIKDLSGDDFRPLSKDRRLKEIELEWTRPIV